MRRKFLTGLASLTLLDIATATAADMPVPVYKASPKVAVVPAWTGWYVGGHAGYRWADVNSSPFTIATFGTGTTTIPGFNDSFKPDGFFGGAHIGYNWQYNLNWLFSLEGDWSWGRSKDSVAAVVTGLDSQADGFTFRRNSEVTLQWQATIRARAGYVFDTWLWYATGGIAFARAKWTDSTSVTGQVGEFTSASLSAGKTLTGWVVGAGVEQIFVPNWTWRVEYLFERFGDLGVPDGFGPLDLENVHKVRIGISYKFGAPLVGKY